MPRHPPYTLKSLATFIEHRWDFKLLVVSYKLPVRPYKTSYHQPITFNLQPKSSPAGLPERGKKAFCRRSIFAHELLHQQLSTSSYQLSSPPNNGSIRQKGARRHLPEPPRISNFKSEISNSFGSRRKNQGSGIDPLLHHTRRGNACGHESMGRHRGCSLSIPLSSLIPIPLPFGRKTKTNHAEDRKINLTKLKSFNCQRASLLWFDLPVAP